MQHVHNIVFGLILNLSNELNSSQSPKHYIGICVNSTCIGSHIRTLLIPCSYQL